MDLEYTDKYFPKTYKYLKTTFGDNQTKANLPKFIKQYSLGGLTILNPKTTKSVNVLPNDVDDSDSKAITSVKKFNSDLQLMAKDYCLIVLPKNSNATLMDSYIYDALKGFVSSHYDINSRLMKYIDVDSLLLDDIKNHTLHIVCQKDDSYLVYDIYKPVHQFNFKLTELSNLELAIVNHSHEALSHIDNSVKTKLNADSNTFNNKIKPILPWLMVNETGYYNRLIKFGRLLHVLCIAFHV